MKKLIITTALTSCFVSAYSHADSALLTSFNSEVGVAISSISLSPEDAKISKDSAPVLMAYPDYDEDGDKHLYFAYSLVDEEGNLHNKCENDKSIDNVIFIVDNQPVKMMSYCFHNRLMNTALSERGNDYIVNEFKHKNIVEIESIIYSEKVRFSAEGFTAKFDAMPETIF